MEMTGQMGDQDATEVAWANRMSAGVLEYIESKVIHTTSKPGQLTIEAEREDAVSAPQDVVGMLDAAFVDYAAEHEGLYPTDPQQLVTEG